MIKKKIVIASILKPLRDPRHYERFALSLAKTNKYEVNIIANGEKKPNTSNIRFYSNGKHGRKFVHRLKLHWHTYFHVMRIQPDLFIVCTVELLPFAILYSIITRCKLVYDVQENYALNFKYLKEYGWVHRQILAPLIRGTEVISSWFVNHHLLAERCYAEQLHFLYSNFTVLENKTVLDSPFERTPPTSHTRIKFLFSGTISAYAGIYRILDLITYLKSLKTDFEFTIIGQVFDPRITSALSNFQSANIHIKVDNSPVAHGKILDEIQHADIGVIAYQSLIVNAHKIPTKLYEYVAFGLPYLVEKGSYWEEVGTRLGGAIPVDYYDLTASISPGFIDNLEISFNKKDQSKSLWTTEESKLFKSIETLLK